MLCPSTLVIGTRAHTQPLCAPAGMFWLAGRVCASECVSSHIMMINMWKCFRCQLDGALPVHPPPSTNLPCLFFLLKYFQNSSLTCLFSLLYFHSTWEWPIIFICAFIENSRRRGHLNGWLSLGYWGESLGHQGRCRRGGCFYTGLLSERCWAHN